MAFPYPESGSPPFHLDTSRISASAATVLRSGQRNAVWAVGCGLVLTRIVLLAHWTSDVVAGLALGAGIERLLRFVTGFGRR